MVLRSTFGGYVAPVTGWPRYVAPALCYVALLRPFSWCYVAQRVCYVAPTEPLRSTNGVLCSTIRGPKGARGTTVATMGG